MPGEFWFCVSVPALPGFSASASIPMLSVLRFSILISHLTYAENLWKYISFFTLSLSWTILTKQQLLFFFLPGKTPHNTKQASTHLYLTGSKPQRELSLSHYQEAPFYFWACKMITKIIFTRAHCFPSTWSQVLADCDQECLTRAWNAKQNKFSGRIICTQNEICVVWGPEPFHLDSIFETGFISLLCTGWTTLVNISLLLKWTKNQPGL